MWGIEGEEPGVELLEGESAVRAVHLGAEDPQAFGGLVLGGLPALCGAHRGFGGCHRKGLCRSFADLQGPAGQVEDSFPGSLGDRPDKHVDRVFLEAFERFESVHVHFGSVHQEHRESLLRSPASLVGVVTLPPSHKVGVDLHVRLPGHGGHLVGDGGEGAFANRDTAVRAVLGAELREKKAEELVNLGDRGHGGLASAPRDPLLDCHAGRESLDGVDVGLLELLDELPRVRGHAVEEASLALRKEDVEGQRRLSASAESGDDRHAVAGDIDTDFLEIVLPGAADADLP